MSTLILLRHGQSQWNLENRFTGWTDVDLTPAGRGDAVLTGKSLKGVTFDAVFVSRLKRAWQTYEGVVEGHGPVSVTPERDSALNERHYGDLQGLNKADTIKKFGEEQVKLWRRSYDVRPPNGESMDDCVRRTLPYFKQYVLPELTGDRTVLIVAHGNSIKPIVMHLDGLSGPDSAALEIPLVVPIVYTFKGDKVVNKEIRVVPGMEVKSTATIK
jgi:2,3-bisphosphoglycerate-dependent phosphoglycerate mutase